MFMDSKERKEQFKEKLSQVAVLMEEMKVLADHRYDDPVQDDLYMLHNFGSKGDIYTHMNEACKHYRITID